MSGNLSKRLLAWCIIIGYRLGCTDNSITSEKSRIVGNHLWAQGYCVVTVGLNAEMIQKYVKHQETKERFEVQLTIGKR